MKLIALVAGVLSLIPILRADGLPLGTWVKRPTKVGSVAIAMIIEAAGSGRRITYKLQIANGSTSTMVVTTQLDGKDAPVLVDGKPSGETMAIRFLDDRHSTGVVKMDGKPISTSKSELSADGKVIKVENTSTAPGGENSTEYWDKK